MVSDTIVAEFWVLVEWLVVSYFEIDIFKSVIEVDDDVLQKFTHVFTVINCSNDAIRQVWRT